MNLKSDTGSIITVRYTIYFTVDEIASWPTLV